MGVLFFVLTIPLFEKILNSLLPDRPSKVATKAAIIIDSLQ
jgi:hypothetical protein